MLCSILETWTFFLLFTELHFLHLKNVLPHLGLQSPFVCQAEHEAVYVVNTGKFFLDFF